MDIRKLFLALPVLLALLGALTSCDKLIYDQNNYDNCERGIYVNFYAQTECADAPSYPVEVTRLNVYAFDANNVLCSTQTVDNVRLSSDYELLVPLKDEGLYTILAWGNISGHYDLRDVVVGQTTKQQILFRLKQAGMTGEDLTGATLWYGESPVAHLQDMEDGGDQYIHTRANLREYTNRVTVFVEGVPNPEDYEVRLASSNGTYQINGKVAKADSTYYPGETLVVSDSTARAFFTTLKLESGHENTLIVMDKKTGREFFRTDLVGIILTSNHAANINFRCLNDFEVRLKANPCNGGYMIVEVWVNDWLVHTYDVEF